MRIKCYDKEPPLKDLTEQEYLDLYIRLKETINTSTKISVPKNQYYKYILRRCLGNTRRYSLPPINVRRFIKRHINIFKNDFLNDVNEESTMSNLIKMIDSLTERSKYDTAKGFLELKDTLNESRQLASKAEDLVNISSGIAERLEKITDFMEGRSDTIPTGVLVVPPLKGFPHYPKDEAPPNGWNYTDRSDSEDDVRM